MSYTSHSAAAPRRPGLDRPLTGEASTASTSGSPRMPSIVAAGSGESVVQADPSDWPGLSAPRVMLLPPEASLPRRNVPKNW